MFTLVLDAAAKVNDLQATYGPIITNLDPDVVNLDITMSPSTLGEPYYTLQPTQPVNGQLMTLPVHEYSTLFEGTGRTHAAACSCAISAAQSLQTDSSVMLCL